jgi:hypothetical protein
MPKMEGSGHIGGGNDNREIGRLGSGALHMLLALNVQRREHGGNLVVLGLEESLPREKHENHKSRPASPTRHTIHLQPPLDCMQVPLGQKCLRMRQPSPFLTFLLPSLGRNIRVCVGSLLLCRLLLLHFGLEWLVQVRGHSPL